MSAAIDFVRKSLRILRAYRRTKSIDWAFLLESYGIDVRIYQCEARADGVYFNDLDCTFEKPEQNVLLAGLQRAARLHACGAVFNTKQSPIRATIQSVSVSVETTEELFILEEIYLEDAYRFELQGSLLIFDIGMNAGYTALYFASKHQNAIISAYELVPSTYNVALNNIQSNHHLGSRITPHCYGLSNSNRTIDIEYSEKWRGSVGVFGMPESLKNDAAISIESGILRDAAEEIRSVKSKFPQRKIVLKVDCEGSEYSILGHLEEAELLQSVDMIMIECHKRAKDHDPNQLRNSLSNLGFGCLHFHADSVDISMLYATNMSQRK